MDQNLTPKKSNAEFPSHQKFPESIKWYNYDKSSNCFEYHQKNLLKSSYQKKYLLKFSYLKNPKIENIKPQKIL